MKLPPTLNIPWDDKAIETFAKNPAATSYLKNLVLALRKMYGDVAGVVNRNAELEYIAQDAQPTPGKGQLLVWEDTAAGEGAPTHYLVYNDNGSVVTFDSNVVLPPPPPPPQYLESITDPTTITVKTSGGDYTNLQDAYNSLLSKWLGATVTIEIDDGLWTQTSNITLIHHPCYDKIVIKGKNLYSKNMSSVVSSSGVAGNYSIVIQLDDVGNIAVDDLAVIHTQSGGTNPDYAAGCHKITAVDGTNKRITVNSLNKTGVPSGAVTATVGILKTIFNMQGYSIRPQAHDVVFKNIGAYGTGNIFWPLARASLTIENCGISSAVKGFLLDNRNYMTKTIDSFFGISGCSEEGMLIRYKSMFWVWDTSKKLAISGCNVGLAVIYQGFARVVQATITGNTTNASPALNTEGNVQSYISTD